MTSLGNTTRNISNSDTSPFAKDLLMDRSLKGLLMDKGASGINSKLQEFLRKITLLHAAMEALVEQQRLSREQSSCECLDLYLATNLKTGRDKHEAERFKGLGTLEVLINHTKGAAQLEWRARKPFAQAYGYPSTTRVHAFNKGHAHHAQVREYVESSMPDYYKVLAGYDAIRVSLNTATKTLRRTIFDLSALSEETEYPIEVERDAENMSRRIFKGLPESAEIAQVLNQLYC